MGKVYICPSHAWVIPKDGEKPLKITFDPPEWQVEEQDDKKGILFSRKLTEEELTEFKAELGMKPEDNKIGIYNAGDIIDLTDLEFFERGVT